MAPNDKSTKEHKILVREYQGNVVAGSSKKILAGSPIEAEAAAMREVHMLAYLGVKEAQKHFGEGKGLIQCFYFYFFCFCFSSGVVLQLLFSLCRGELA